MSCANFAVLELSPKGLQSRVLHFDFDSQVVELLYDGLCRKTFAQSQVVGFYRSPTNVSGFSIRFSSRDPHDFFAVGGPSHRDAICLILQHIVDNKAYSMPRELLLDYTTVVKKGLLKIRQGSVHDKLSFRSSFEKRTIIISPTILYIFPAYQFSNPRRAMIVAPLAGTTLTLMEERILALHTSAHDVVLFKCSTKETRDSWTDTLFKVSAVAAYGSVDNVNTPASGGRDAKYRDILLTAKNSASAPHSATATTAGPSLLQDPSISISESDRVKGEISMLKKLGVNDVQSAQMLSGSLILNSPVSGSPITSSLRTESSGTCISSTDTASPRLDDDQEGSDDVDEREEAEDEDDKLGDEELEESKALLLRELEELRGSTVLDAIGYSLKQLVEQVCEARIRRTALNTIPTDETTPNTSPPPSLNEDHDQTRIQQLEAENAELRRIADTLKKQVKSNFVISIPHSNTAAASGHPEAQRTAGPVACRIAPSSRGPSSAGSSNSRNSPSSTDESTTAAAADCDSAQQQNRNVRQLKDHFDCLAQPPVSMRDPDVRNLVNLWAENRGNKPQ